MNDDIVTRLLEEIDSLKVDVQVLRDAADEIEGLRAEVNMMASAQAGWGRVERLNNEIELLTEWRKSALLALDKRETEIGRLRAAGNALADALRSGSDSRWDKAIDDWEEARRG